MIELESLELQFGQVQARAQEKKGMEDLVQSQEKETESLEEIRDLVEQLDSMHQKVVHLEDRGKRVDGVVEGVKWAGDYVIRASSAIEAAEKALEDN